MGRILNITGLEGVTKMEEKSFTQNKKISCLISLGSVLMVCLYPCLFQWFNNIDEAPVKDLFPMLPIFLRIAIVVWGIAYLVIRRFSSAAFFTSVAMFMFINIGMCSSLLKGHIGWLQDRYVIVAGVIILATLLDTQCGVDVVCAAATGSTMTLGENEGYVYHGSYDAYVTRPLPQRAFDIVLVQGGMNDWKLCAPYGADDPDFRIKYFRTPQDSWHLNEAGHRCFLPVIATWIYDCWKDFMES